MTQPGRLLVFRVGERRFALPLEVVLGVQDTADGERGPGGVVVRNGRELPTLDAAALGWGGSGARQPGKPAAFVIIGDPNEMAIIVDGIEGLVEAGEISAWPSLIAPFVEKVFRGVVVRPGGDLVVIDPAALQGLARERMNQDGRGGAGEA